MTDMIFVVLESIGPPYNSRECCLEAFATRYDAEQKVVELTRYERDRVAQAHERGEEIPYDDRYSFRVTAINYHG